MKWADLATAKLTTLDGLYVVRQKDTELYLNACDLAADVVDVTNLRDEWLVYPNQAAAEAVVAEITKAEAAIVAHDPQYSVPHYEPWPVRLIAELDFDLTSKGKLTHRLVGLGFGNGPFKAFLKDQLKTLRKARKQCDRDLKAHDRELHAERTRAQKNHKETLLRAERDYAASMKSTRDDVVADDKLIEVVEHLLNPPAPRSLAKKRPLARSMTQKKAAARRGATGRRKGKARGRK